MKSWLEKMDKPVLSLAPATHPELDILRRRVFALYDEQYAYLESKSTEYLTELQHRSEEGRNSHIFSERTAAEINRTACVVILEKRATALALYRAQLSTAHQQLKGRS